MSTTQPNDELLDILVNLNGAKYGQPYSINQAREAIQRLIVEAEQRGVAWAVMAIDDLHINHGDTFSLTGDIDKTYKGIKNTIRDRFKRETGIDPAPNYPIHAELQASLNTKQESK